MMFICAIRASELSDAAGNEDGGTDGARLTLRVSEGRNICEAGVLRGDDILSRS